MAKKSNYIPKPNTVGYEIMNGNIDAREEGLRILSKESDRQMLLKELAKKAKRSKDPSEIRSINSTLKRFGYEEVKIVSSKSPAGKPVTQRSPKVGSTNGVKKTGEAAARSTGANAQSRQAAPTAPKSAPSFTVMAGRKSKTFATKKEAKAYEKAVRGKTGKPHKIRESTRKPTHRLVSFTAKK